MDTCIICFEPMDTKHKITDYYVFECDCKYDVHKECLAQWNRCIICQQRITRRPNKWFVVCVYIVISPLCVAILVLYGMTAYILGRLALVEMRTLFLVDN